MIKSLRVSFIFSVSILLLTSADLFSQKGEEVGGYIGTSFYFGDLNTSLMVQKPGPALGLFAKKNFNGRLSLRGSLNFARVGASDANSSNNFQRGRNLSFSSNIFNIAGGVEFNFLNHIHGSLDEWYTPYLYAGIEVLRFNPTAELNGTTYNLRDFGTEGQELGGEYSLISGGLVLGAGFKYDISKNLSLQIEATWHRLFTDYLDDVSTVYPDFGNLEADRGQIAVDLSDRSTIDGIGITGRQRGNSRNNDTYILVSVGISRYFGHIECPKISSWD